MEVEAWASLLRRIFEIQQGTCCNMLIRIQRLGKVLQDSWLHSLGSWFCLVCIWWPNFVAEWFHRLLLPWKSSRFKVLFSCCDISTSLNSNWQHFSQYDSLELSGSPRNLLELMSLDKSHTHKSLG